MKAQVGLGGLELRFDFVLLALGLGLYVGLTLGALSGVRWASAFAVAVALHELGHAVAARALGAPFRWVAQLGGGALYEAELSGIRAAAVLVAGPLAGAGGAALGLALRAADGPEGLGPWGTALAHVSLVWSVFQLMPYPPLDGGRLLQRALLDRFVTATHGWQLGWTLGFAASLGIVAYDPKWLETVVWLSGLAVLLGRSEAGYVRHVDAYGAWERGDKREVVARVRAMPEYLPRPDQLALLELGLVAALDLEDAAAVEDLAARLPVDHPKRVRAAEWLLRHERPFGARLAQQALDALDAERVDRKTMDRERWADMLFHFAVHEARALNPASALGLLERAADLGFDDAERLQADGALGAMHDHPRWHALLARLTPA